MKLNDRYEIRIVVIEELDESGMSGDCDDNFNRFKKEHPYSSYKFGFIVYDIYNKSIPDNCNEWNGSIEDALIDYENNICKQI